MQFFLFLALILSFVLVLFAIQNSTLITLTFIKWKFEGSFAFILAIVFAGGMMAGIFLSIPTWWRKSRENRAKRKRIQELEREVSNMTEHGDAPEFDEPGEASF